MAGTHYFMNFTLDIKLMQSVVQAYPLIAKSIVLGNFNIYRREALKGFSLYRRSIFYPFHIIFVRFAFHKGVSTYFFIDPVIILLSVAG